MRDSTTYHYESTGTPQALAAQFDGEHDATLTISKAKDRRIELLLTWAERGIWATLQTRSERDGRSGNTKASTRGARAAHAVAPLLLSEIKITKPGWLVIDAPSDEDLMRLTGLKKSSVTLAIKQLRWAGVLTNSDLRGGRHYRLYFEPHSARKSDTDRDRQRRLAFDEARPGALDLELGDPKRAGATPPGRAFGLERAGAVLPGRAEHPTARPGARAPARFGGGIGGGSSPALDDDVVDDVSCRFPNEPNPNGSDPPPIPTEPTGSPPEETQATALRQAIGRAGIRSANAIRQIIGLEGISPQAVDHCARLAAKRLPDHAKAADRPRLTVRMLLDGDWRDADLRSPEQRRADKQAAAEAAAVAQAQAQRDDAQRLDDETAHIIELLGGLEPGQLDALRQHAAEDAPTENARRRWLAPDTDWRDNAWLRNAMLDEAIRLKWLTFTTRGQRR